MQAKITAINSNNEVKYLHWSLLLPIALIISHLIVVESQNKPALVLIHQLNYRLAMAFSWPFTFLLMYWIHWATKKLDAFVPWTNKWFLRFFLQLICCVILVLVVDVLVVRGYFIAFGGNFATSGYMEIEFPIVRWMVLFMNALYIAWFFAKKYFDSKKLNEGLKEYISYLNDKRENEEFYSPKIEARLGNKTIKLTLNEVACFERIENLGYVHLVDGRKFNMKLKLSELGNLIDTSSFYQINRSVMISFAAIKGYEKVKNQQAEIILKEGLSLDVSLLVSRDRFEGFKKSYDAYKSN